MSRPRKFPPESRARGVQLSTHWSTRSMAARVGIGKDAVAKIWADACMCGRPGVR
jgi:hypothetical protein